MVNAQHGKLDVIEVAKEVEECGITFDQNKQQPKGGGMTVLG